MIQEILIFILALIIVIIISIILANGIHRILNYYQGKNAIKKIEKQTQVFLDEDNKKIDLEKEINSQLNKLKKQK